MRKQTHLSAIHHCCKLIGTFALLLTGPILLSCQQPQKKDSHKELQTFTDSIVVPIRANSPQELARAWAISDSAKAAFMKRHRNITKMEWYDNVSTGYHIPTGDFSFNTTYNLEIQIGTDSTEYYAMEMTDDVRLFRQRYQEDVPPPPPLGSAQAEAALRAVYLKGFTLRKAARAKSEALGKKVTEETETMEKAAREAYAASFARPVREK